VSDDFVVTAILHSVEYGYESYNSYNRFYLKKVSNGIVLLNKKISHEQAKNIIDNGLNPNSVFL